MFRKIIASLIFVVFVVASVPFFLGLSLGKTFLSRSFYSGTLLDTAYAPLVDFVALNVRDMDPLFEKSFTEGEIRQRVEKHFTQDVVRKLIQESFDQFDQNVAQVPTENSRKDLTVRIGLAPLVQASRGFLSEIVQDSLGKIPPCKPNEQPVVTNIFPSCTMSLWQTPEFREKFRSQFETAYQDKIFKKFAGNNGDFSYDLELGLSKNRYLSIAQTLEYAGLYMSSFLLAFTILMLLVWMKRWDIGLRWTGSMWMTSAVLGTIFAIFIFFSSRLIPAHVLEVPAESAAYVNITALVHVLSVSFVKIYGLFLFLAFLVGLFFYLLARKFDSISSESL